MWEIQDNNGVIYSGDREEMENIYSILTNPKEHDKNEIEHYSITWNGDLKLAEIHCKYKQYET